MMSESKQIESGDQAASTVYTESEYEALKKKNARLKQTVEEQCAREREKIAELKIAEDISQLLVTGKWSDVTISVGEKKFALHRNILSSRSSIFADLLEKNSKENCLVISDVDVDVFEMLLRFIYTGKVPELEPKMAEDLLTAAEKYKLEQLKSFAEDYLCGQLFLESVARLLPFAESVNASKLKDKCMELLNSLASPPTTPRPLPPIARLHDPCLVALFRQLPPADQMTARTVCHRWADLVPYAARSTHSLAILVDRPLNIAEGQINYLSHGRHFYLLKLLQKEDGTPLLPMHSLSPWNSLQFATLNAEIVAQITATFPVLKELQLSAYLHGPDDHCDCYTATPPPSLIEPIIYFLEHWRPQLTALKLDIGNSFENGSSCSRLGDAISSLSALKHLYLDLYWNGQPHCPALSNLPQLTHFTTNSKQAINMLRQYDPQNLALVQIGFDGGYGSNGPTIDEFTSLNQDLRRRFVRIDGRSVDYRTFLRHFPSLTTVSVSLSVATFRDLLNHASQLTQLIHLKLSIDCQTVRPDDQPHLLLPQLKSVKYFNIILYMQSHSALEPLNLPWTMPNVQVIDIGISSLQCSTCDLTPLSTSNRKKKHCLRQMFAPLKRNCAKLHTIKHNCMVNVLGTAEEILAEPIIEAASSSSDTDSSTGNSSDEVSSD